MQKKSVTFSYDQGFTLIELCITLALILLLASLGIPYGQDWWLQARAEMVIHRLNAAVSFAHSTALAQGKTVTLCPSSDGQQCHGHWSQGYVVFIDEFNDQRPHSPEYVLRFFEAVTADEKLVFTGFFSNDYLRIQPFTNTYQQNGTFVYCPKKDPERFARALVINTSGRVRLVNKLDGELLMQCSPGATRG